MSYYLRLKDQSTSFYDMTTGISIVRTQVAKLKKLSGRMNIALNNGLLIRLSETEGEAAWKEQNPEAKPEEAKAPKAAEQPAKVEQSEEAPEADEEPETESLDKGSGKPTKPTPPRRK